MRNVSCVCLFFLLGEKQTVFADHLDASSQTVSAMGGRMERCVRIERDERGAQGAGSSTLLRGMEEKMSSSAMVDNPESTGSKSSLSYKRRKGRDERYFITVYSNRTVQCNTQTGTGGREGVSVLRCLGVYLHVS